MHNGNSTAPAGERADGIGLTRFADTNLHGPSSVQSFKIRNAGTATLTGLALSLASTQVADYALGSLATTSLAPGRTTPFTVTLLPAAVGQRDARLAIASNDADENPFDIALGGVGRSANL
ncbi:MAG TPA: choice-of-anchor D domain-containing protein [Pseudomonadota bacterium]|jgi:hypothetical protein|nr:choice-of-anchor D domain-containing protein [Pseudomonadota bacterium]